MSDLDSETGSRESWSLESVDACPVCGARERQVLYRDLTDRLHQSSSACWSLYACARCRSAFLDPRPTPESIHLAYASYHTHQAPADPTFVGFHRFQHALANGYRNWRYGSRNEPALALGIPLALLSIERRSRFDRGFRYLPRAHAGARVLDVGFGNGAFMETAASAGWQVAGADFDPKVIRRVADLGFEVRQGGIEVFADQPRSFDAITMAHVIEHLHRPLEALARAFELLRPGGRLYLDTPNIASLGHRWFGADWRGLEPPRHLVLFNWSSLRLALKETGFVAIRSLPDRSHYNVRGMLASSRALRGASDARLTGRGLPALARILNWLNYRGLEFITLQAERPGGDGER